MLVYGVIASNIYHIRNSSGKPHTQSSSCQLISVASGKLHCNVRETEREREAGLEDGVGNCHGGLGEEGRFWRFSGKTGGL